MSCYKYIEKKTYSIKQNLKTFIHHFFFMNPHKSHNNSYRTGPEIENFHNRLMQLPENADRKNKIKQLMPIDEYLKAYHIPKSLRFSKIFNNNKIRRSQQIEIIIFFESYHQEDM